MSAPPSPPARSPVLRRRLSDTVRSLIRRSRRENVKRSRSLFSARSGPQLPAHPHNLPYEILVHILKSLQSSALSSLCFKPAPYHHAGQSPPVIIDENHVTPAFRKALSSLAHSALVCKSWYFPATEVLYSQSFIVGQCNLQIFTQALLQNEALAPLVKGIWVFQYRVQKKRRLSSHSFKCDDFDRSSRGDFADALRSCTSLVDLTFTSFAKSHGPTLLPWESEFTPGSPLGQQLRALTIYSNDVAYHPLELVPVNASFPHLGTLILVFTTNEHLKVLPYIPSLHTLQVCNLNGDSDNVSENPLVVMSSLLPSLRNLSLIHAVGHVQVDRDCLNQLQTLHLFGHSDRGFIQDENALLNLRELEVDSQYFCPIPRLPAKLQKLVVYLSFSVNKSSTPPAIRRSYDLGVLQRSLANLTQNCAAFSEVCLRFEETFEGLDRSEMDDTFRAISESFLPRRITLCVDYWCNAREAPVEYLMEAT
ncbi:hypothetical protein NLI96_g11441 [Meripilus lineatus]|uniref:F-box domain-containing protein n=1 Tax=Meripilus lineatus TaxID=2056292 RepID=A0AAD5YDD6_9APHY|nr:hypothetical protein NLI96_g11441 [Physisporinus lineatus]